MARWPSGKVAVCKTAYVGSIPTRASSRSVAQWKSTALRRQVSQVQILSGLSDNPYKFGRRIPNWVDADAWAKEHGLL